jgi:hypothetical protein
MAGENVPEAVVRKVFAASIDLVVHCEREAARGEDGAVRRQVREILAVAPSLHDDFTTEPIFLRDRVGMPMRWTGAQPPDRLSKRLEQRLPPGRSLVDVLDGGMRLP